MKRRVFIFAAVFLALLVSAPWSAAPTQASTVLFTMNEKVPFGPVTVFVPCADGGDGEDVVVTGYLHQVQRVMIDNAGGFHLSWTNNAAGLVGVGQSTGNKYRGTGCENQSIYQAAGYAPTAYSYVDHYGLIGPGPDGKSTLRVTEQTTIDANGNFRTIINKVESECFE